MTLLRDLAVLKDIQRLREEGCKSELTLAASHYQAASEAAETALHAFTKSKRAFLSYSQEQDIEITRFQILASQVNHLADQFEATQSKKKAAFSVAQTARKQLLQAEKQSDALAESYRAQWRKEQRKLEDNESRDFANIISNTRGGFL